MLFSQEETERGQSQQRLSVPHGQLVPSWQLTWGHWPERTLLVLPQKDPVLTLQGTQRAAGLARRHQTHMLKQNQGTHSESGTGKESPPQGDETSTGAGLLTPREDGLQAVAQPPAAAWGSHDCLSQSSRINLDICSTNLSLANWKPNQTPRSSPSVKEGVSAEIKKIF